MKFEIRFRDIDPDTGYVSQDMQIATCEDEAMANWVMHALHLAQLEDHSPNRTIYAVPITKMS